MNNNYESHAISRRSFLKASGVVGAAGILAACGGNSGSSSTAASSGATSAPNTTGATPLKEFISWESTNRELESWNMLYSQMASDMNVTTNLWEGLLSFDCYGKAVPSVAKEWSHNEDSSVWTFNLRDDVDWVDVNGEVKAHLTSKDFLVGLEWVLNAAKNQANNTSIDVASGSTLIFSGVTAFGTNFNRIKPGTLVNLEFDIIGKYIARLMKNYLK